jgi:site-specific recombinase XerD
MMSKELSDFVVAQRMRAGALEIQIATFATALTDRGYAESTAKQQIRLAADFGRWLARCGVVATELEEQHARAFLTHLRRCGRAPRNHRTTLRILLSVLRDIGIVRPISNLEAEKDANPVAVLVRAFACYLAEERGLQRSTCDNYVPVVRRLLSRRFRRGSIALGSLSPEDVTRFITDEARNSPRRIKITVPALRVFLRWLHQRGDTRTNLTGCVPAVAEWRLASVPKALPSEQVECLLQHCNRATPVGRRDYAILLLLARLGLRAGEVVAMKLDDIDWESGELIVRGKGRREDRLPLPRAVGAAVAAYLRHGRPGCSIRRLFVRARAPCQGFASSVAICNVVERALHRAGLEPPRKGAHTLRHALACTMLRRGASLAEIGQILRHRSPDTTAIYAKVDVAALRALAPAWPQPAGDA